MRTSISFLNDEEKLSIHQSTLEVLEKVGVEIGSDKICGLLSKKGAKVIGKNVRFPADMVTEALELVNQEITLAAREPKYSITIPTKELPYITTAGYVPFVKEESTGEKREATTEDLRNFSIVSDALDDFGLFWPMVIPCDVPAEYQEYHALEVAFKNTTKHVQTSVSSAKIAEWQIELAALIAGGKAKLREAPIVSLLAAPTTPLGIEKGISEAIYTAAQNGIPTVPMSLPQMGSTSPATIAANLLVANAEILSCYMVAKCADDKAPVIYAADAGAPDLRTCAIDYNNPEYFLLSSGNADMARFYKMPSMVSAAMTEYKDFSSPAGFERNVMKTAMAMMTRSDLGCWLGSVDRCLCASLVDVILDIEAYRYAKWYLRSFSADPYKLAVDIISEVGPRGCFLGNKHTFQNFKKEIFTETIQDSFIFRKDTGKSYRELAVDRLNEILETHHVRPIDQSLDAEIEALAKRAYSDLVG